MAIIQNVIQALSILQKARRLGELVIEETGLLHHLSRPFSGASVSLWEITLEQGYLVLDTARARPRPGKASKGNASIPSA